MLRLISVILLVVLPLSASAQMLSDSEICKTARADPEAHAAEFFARGWATVSGAALQWAGRAMIGFLNAAYEMPNAINTDANRIAFSDNTSRMPTKLPQVAVFPARGMVQPTVQVVMPGSGFQFSSPNFDYPFRTIPPPAESEGLTAQLALNPTRDQRVEQGRA